MPQRQILTAPAGGGKTTAALETITSFKHDYPWAVFWIVLPTSLQRIAFQDRLLKHQKSVGHSSSFGIHYFTFYELYQHLLERLHIPQREVAQPAVYRIIRQLIATQEIQTNLRYLSPIIERPGLIDLVASFIFELKQAHITPEAFIERSDYLPAGKLRDKTHDIGYIYAAYQQFLRQHEMVDREGRGWLALAYLEDYAPDEHLFGVNQLIVDGFVNFSPLQARLLNRLSEFVPMTLLTLTHEKARATSLHRSFDHILHRLQDYGLPWEVTPLQIQNTWQNPPLTYLQEHFMSAQVPSISADSALSLLEAPSLAAEVQMVLRSVKGRLLAGTEPDEILILCRTLDDYADLLRTTAARYGIPLLVRQETSLQQNPAIATLLELMRLHDPATTNFHRQTLLDMLRNPYLQTPFTEDEVLALEKISLRYKIVGGREKWLRALKHALEGQNQAVSEPILTSENDEDTFLPMSFMQLAQDFAQRLTVFFDRITPPPFATIRNYIAWLEALIGIDPLYDNAETIHHRNSFNLYEQVRQDIRLPEVNTVYTASQTIITRDLQALKEFRGCLLEILSAHELIAGDAELPQISWGEFLGDVERALRQTKTGPGEHAYRSRHVLATTVFEARGLPHSYIYIMGLSEGNFPAARPEDPLYSRRERVALNDLGIQVTLPQHEEDDSSVFYTCAAMAQTNLTLSRTTIDNRANLWEASILWQATNQLLTNAELTRMAAGAPPDLPMAADDYELVVSMSFAQNIMFTYPPELLADWTNYLAQRYPFIWRNIATTREVAQRRQHVFDEFSGQIQAPELRSAIADELHPNYVWSASQFNDYGYCPFRFFARRLLKLEAFEEPDEGPDAMQLGSLQHEILEYTYRRFATTQFPLVPEKLPEALDILTTKAEDVFRDAPFRLQFAESGVWEKEKEEIIQRLQNFVRHDFENGLLKPKDKVLLGEAQDSVRYVYAIEAPFGLDEVPPAVLDGPTGRLMARGLIDRIDRIGDKLVIIDYKSGSSLPDMKEIERGRNFQMMLYLHAAHQLLAKSSSHLTLVAGAFWSLRQPDKPVLIPAHDSRLLDAYITLHTNINAARAGDFRVQPRKMEDGKCSRYCEYHHLCREIPADLYKSG